jgi:hypothetical protein
MAGVPLARRANVRHAALAFGTNEEAVPTTDIGGAGVIALAAAWKSANRQCSALSF